MRGAGRAGPTSRLAARAVVMSYLLVVQFFAGMVTNLYVTIPGRHPGSDARDYFTGAADSVGWALTRGDVWLAGHAALGLALAVGALELVFHAVRSRQGMWIWVSVAGAAFVIGAGFNGASFLVFGRDYSSLIMAGLFGLSLVSYLTGLFLDRR
jgi:hypothetical protein